jgi:hypothetical protein
MLIYAENSQAKIDEIWRREYLKVLNITKEKAVIKHIWGGETENSTERESTQITENDLSDNEQILRRTSRCCPYTKTYTEKKKKEFQFMTQRTNGQRLKRVICKSLYFQCELELASPDKIGSSDFQVAVVL